MPQIFRPYVDTVVRIVLLSLLVLPVAAVATAYAVMWSPYVTGEGITYHQPIPFSHAHHVGKLGLDCRYCHESVERSSYAAVPPTHTCMTCHSQLFTAAKVLEPLRQSLATGIPIRWKQVNSIPDYVYFDHSVHVANGVGCTTCHGQVDTMPLMRKAAPMTMAWCLDCHRNVAAHLRPRSAIFSTDWRPPKNQAEQGRLLMAEYHIRTEHLTDCSVCHR